MRKRSIKEILTQKVFTVSPETSILEAISLMEDNKISCLVITQNEKPVGIFTERDVVLVADRRDHLADIQMKKFISRSVVTANSDMDLYEAYNLLQMRRIRHLVVMDSNAELAGMVTQTDISKALGAEYFIEFKSVSEIMTKDVVTIKKRCLVSDAISKMAKHSISCIVVEEDEHPVGTLTERDVVRLLRERIDMKHLEIEEVMSRPVITMSSEPLVHEAARVMERKKIRRLVVVDEDGRISGVLTQSDVIRELKEGYMKFLRKVAQEETG